MKAWIDALNHLTAGLLLQGGYLTSPTRIERREFSGERDVSAADAGPLLPPSRLAPAGAHRGDRAPCPG